jgi:hypothetical protein
MRYTLVRPDNSIDRSATNIDPTAQTKPGYRWLPCIQGTMPVVDPSLETLEGPTYSVGVADVTENWTKRNLTAQEISARQNARLNTIDSLQFLVLFEMENRLRVLESKAPITAAQYRAALKARL